MAKKKEKIDYAQLPVDELKSRLVETREKIFQARFKNPSAALKNPMIIRALRRDIARISTFLNQRGMK